MLVFCLHSNPSFVNHMYSETFALLCLDAMLIGGNLYIRLVLIPSALITTGCLLSPSQATYSMELL